ncbi:phage protein Gp37 [Acinetobacter haemolyticus]|uniref:phage protein Gp37 n=1 Tax=Acinetobacter haemolyticus TaxID=29430 RepID=UPI000F736431|nr:phage protein Gp37 [Acinetobacter haemolyticus]RSN77899.1 DUF1834 family protein [Acinetobacter haemolyticus]
MDLSAIEQGIKDAIKALGRQYIAAIDTYGGEFDEHLSDAIKRFPAVWTTFQGSGKPEQLSTRKFRVPLVFVVLVGAYSIRNEKAARNGIEVDGQLVSVGTFQLLQDVQLALLNNNLAAHGVCGITPLTLGKIDKIYDKRTQDAGISVFAQQWHTSCVVTQSASDRDLDAPIADWMQKVNVDYHVNNDDVAEATDLIILN